jgi:hypothetical protein
MKKVLVVDHEEDGILLRRTRLRLHHRTADIIEKNGLKRTLSNML